MIYEAFNVLDRISTVGRWVVCVVCISILSTALYAQKYDEDQALRSLLLYKQSAQYHKAIALAKEILIHLKQHPQRSDREAVLTVLYLQLAEYYLHLHQNADALLWLKKLASIDSQKIPQPFRKKVAQLLYGVGEVQMQAGKIENALLFVKQAYHLSLLEYGSEGIETIQCQYLLGEVYAKKGSYQAAAQSTLEVYEKFTHLYPSLKRDRLAIAKTLGSYLVQAGRYKEALDPLNYALRETKISDDQSAKEVASLHNMIGLAYLKLDSYPEAQEHLEEAVTIKQRYYQNDESLVKIYNHLAMLAQLMGDLDKAKALYQKALSVTDRRYVKDSALQKALYANMAQLLMEEKAYAKAIEFFHQALAWGDQESIEQASILSNLGLLYLDQNESDKAQKVLKKAIKLKTTHFGSLHFSLVPTYLNLAAVQNARGALDDALATEKRALKILKQMPIVHHDLLQRVYHTISETYTMQNNYAKAYEAISQAVAHFLHRNVTLYGMSSQAQKRTFKRYHTSLLEHYIAVGYHYSRHLSKPKRAQVLKALLKQWIRLKHAIGDISEAFALYAVKSDDKAFRSAFEAWQRAQRLLARYYQSQKVESDAWIEERGKITKLQALIETKERYLSHVLQQKGLLKDRRGDEIDRLFAHLPPESLYLDIASLSKGYYLFLVTPSGSIALKRYGREERDRIDHLIQTRYKEMEDIGAKRSFADIGLAHKQYGELFSVLDKKIDFGRYKRLFLSLDGYLDLLPFEALYDPEKERFLLDTMKIHYLSSAKKLLSSTKKSTKKLEDVVVFADPDFDAQTHTTATPELSRFATLLPQHFSALPHTRQEAETIKQLFPSTVTFVGKEATEESLFKVNRPQILHIATHGFYLKEAREFMALMRVGIVLSGANRLNAKARGEGIVTGLELAGMALSQTELVVLSSCNSARGDIEESEGMLGLHEAFLKAGAKRVISSLWAVNDRWGKEMMAQMYHFLKEGKSYEDALRSAKQYLIAQGVSHPYYWAGFVLRSRIEPKF